MDNPNLITINMASALALKCRSLGGKVVFTNGCFDLLHAGHVHLLKEAAKLGDMLILGLNGDASVRRLKGESRPVFSMKLRAFTLSGLESVDHVVPFDEDTPIKLIEAIRPEVLVKGGDYTFDTIVGANEVKSWGGDVVSIPLLPGLSSSGILGEDEQ